MAEDIQSAKDQRAMFMGCKDTTDAQGMGADFHIDRTAKDMDAAAFDPEEYIIVGTPQIETQFRFRN